MSGKRKNEVRDYKRLSQVCAFLDGNANRVPPNTPASRALPELASATADVNVKVAHIASLDNQICELTYAKTETRGVLGTQLHALYETAQAVALDQPGFDEKFRSPLKSDAEIVTAARSALIDAAPHVDLFVTYALQPDFLEELNGSLQKFEEACTTKDRMEAIREVDNKDLQVVFNKTMKVAKRFNTIMRNTFKSDAAMLDRWNAAWHVAIPGRKKKADPTVNDHKPQLKQEPPALGQTA